MASSFDLEHAIAAWRRPFDLDRAFTPDDVEELEGGLRDRVEALVEGGMPEETAFHEALRRMGSYGTAETEYRKVYLGKVRRRRGVGAELAWRFALLKSHLTVAGRNVRRHKGYAALNVAGLAAGLAACLLIGLFVREELSYDAFHAHADRLYRVTTTVAAEGQETTYATTVPSLGPTVADRLPAVGGAARLLVEATESNEALVSVGDRRFYERRFAWTDSTFFSLFGVPVLAGDARTALARPFTVALSASTARRYFGDADPIGETLRFNNMQDLEVTAVFADMPARSHFGFDILAALQTFPGMGADGLIDNWGYRGFYTYLLLEEHAEPAALRAQLGEVTRPFLPEPEATSFGLQPITRIHLHSDLEEEIGPTGDAVLVSLIGSVALVVLFIAAINFVNLTTARAGRRAAEVGVRKVVGARRGQLVRQFLLETVLLASAALVVAMGTAAALLPWFNRLTGHAHTLRALASPEVTAGLVVVTASVALLAGAYPAFVLSSFAPMQALRGCRRRGTPSLRRGLIVAQFALAIVLLVMTAAMNRQLDHMQHARLGFDRSQVVALPLHEVFGQPQQDLGVLRAQLLALPGVEQVAATSQLPSRVFSNNWALQLPSDPPSRSAPGRPVEVTAFTVEPGFATTLGLRVVAGQDLRGDGVPDGGVPSGALLINEAAARRFGWDDPVGRTLYNSGGAVAGTVVGVVEDFHVRSLEQPVEPVVLRPGSGGYQYLLVRLRGGEMAETVAAVEDVWEAASTAWPFSYIFLDEAFGDLYRTVERAGRTVGTFAVLALLVACLGVFGLATFAAEERTKELGVRKALGATVAGLVGLLTRELLVLIGIGFVIAVPVAWWVVDRWLAGFAYRVEPGPGIFLGAGGLVLLVALGATALQSVRAARRNPTEALRYE